MYSFSGSPLLLANKENKYSTTFSDQNFPIEENTAIGLTCYEKELQPGESYTIEFKFPRRAISDKEFINLYKQLNYTEEKEKCINYWKQLIEGNGHFSIPEKRVNDSYKAALVHLCLATRTHENGIKRQGSGLPYDGLFFIDFIDMRLAYDVSGLSDFVEVNFDWLRNSINEEGLFVDSSVSHNREIMTSHGQALYSICNHFRYVDNKILPANPFATLDQEGVGQLMQIALEKALPVRPDLKRGICGEHGGDPESVKFCHRIGLNYVSCSPFRVPQARLAAAQAVIEENKCKEACGCK